MYIMKRSVRSEDGLFHLEGKTFKELFGSRQQVFNGTAYKTTGDLRKKNLLQNKWGRIVSESKHFTSKKEKRLERHGYFATPGKFGFTRRKIESKSRKSRKSKK